MSHPAGPSVLHVDLDAFFVSMEFRRHPELAGRPVIVGGAGPRGVVATCSYEARAFGVRSAMPATRARQLCPHAVFLRPDFAYYSEASLRFHAILRDYGPRVEPAGLDEAYIDLAGSHRLLGSPIAIAQEIRRRIHAEIGITASVGVSTNKLVSKVASDAAKPDGMTVVLPGEEAQFLAPRAIRDLPLIGPKTAEALAALGASTIGDIARLSLPVLESRFGAHGRQIQERALGIYRAPVAAGRSAPRSISREVTFETDEADEARIKATVRRQAERVASDMLHKGRSARTVSLKLRFPPFETISRSATRPSPFTNADDIFEAVWNLFLEAWRNSSRRPVRLVGLGVSGLQEQGRQLALGETAAPELLAEAVLDLRDRFGEGAVVRAIEMMEGRTPGRRGTPA